MVTPSAWQGGDLHKRSTAWRSAKLDVPGRYHLPRRWMFTLEYQLRQQRLPDWMDYGTEVTSALTQSTSCTSPSLSPSFCRSVRLSTWTLLNDGETNTDIRLNVWGDCSVSVTKTTKSWPRQKCETRLVRPRARHDILLKAILQGYPEEGRHQVNKKTCLTNFKSGFVAIRTICEVCSTRDQRDVAQLGSRSRDLSRTDCGQAARKHCLNSLITVFQDLSSGKKPKQTNNQNTWYFSAQGFVIKGSWRSGGVN